jgi:predicted Zn-dependent protease
MVDPVGALLEQALARAPTPEAEAVYQAHDSALTRFAASAVHQNVSEHDATLRVRLVDGGRTGVASTNRLDDEGLRDVVARAAAICRRAAVHPDPSPLPEPASARVPAELGLAIATRDASPVLRAAGARAVIDAGRAAGLAVSGSFLTETNAIAVGNSRGLRQSHRATQARLLTVMMGDDGRSGYAQATASDVGEIDAAAVGEEAATRAAAMAHPIDLEPGDYPVILDHYAVQVLLEYMAYDGFSAQALEEGRSFMQLGERVMGDAISIWDDGLDPSGLPSAIDYEGVPKRRVDLVTRGMATGVVHDSATARRAGVSSTGHGLPAPNPWGPLGWNLFMAGGSTPRAQLASGIRRGVWVTRFHYLSTVHERRAIMTGMTRDGTFLIEDGQLTRPLRNLRFTQAIPEAFSAVAAISRETRLVAAEYSGINARVPALRLDRFAFTGATASEGVG